MKHEDFQNPPRMALPSSLRLLDHHDGSNYTLVENHLRVAEFKDQFDVQQEIGYGILKRIGDKCMEITPAVKGAVFSGKIPGHDGAICSIKFGAITDGSS